MTSMFKIVRLARRRYRQFACAACSVAPEDGMGPALLNLFHLFNRGATAHYHILLFP